MEYSKELFITKEVRALCVSMMWKTEVEIREKIQTEKQINTVINSHSFTNVKCKLVK